MQKQQGFTLIELVMFIAVSGLLVTALWLSYATSLKQMDVVLENTIASQTAAECAEIYLAARRLNGYTVFACTSPLTVSTLCLLPTGFSISGDCSATTVGGDPNYETLTLNVTGPGNASLTLLLGNY